MRTENGHIWVNLIGSGYPDSHTAEPPLPGSLSESEGTWQVGYYYSACLGRA